MDWNQPRRGHRTYSVDQFEPSWQFVFRQWCDWAAQRDAAPPVDLSGACRYGALFMCRVFGGSIPNANHALVELLSTLRDHEGRILVEGFFDRVKPLSAAERQAIGAVPFDPAVHQAELGVDALIGEPGYSTYERAWARPTLEVNGLWGGR